jgi:DNA-binding MarR family transcriptional regulator
MVRREDAPALPPGSRDLDTKLVAALERVGQALRTELRERAREHALTPTQAQILLRLASNQPDRRRVGALAATLDLRQPTVSDAVATLERKGLLERRRDAADARVAELRPTKRGLDVAARLDAWDGRARAELRRLPEQEKKRSLELLLELIARLHAAGVVGVARTCPTCRFFRSTAEPNVAASNHCALLDMPLRPGDLRLDCPEHEPAAA